MSDTFPIPDSALREGAGQITLDGEVEEFDPSTPPSMRAYFSEPPAPGEAGLLADVDVLVRAGVLYWSRR